MASKLFPKVYKGVEDSSGYLARNDRPTSRSSPGWKGRVWVSQPGWHWLSGWLVEPRESKKPLLNIKLRGMTDQEATQYCAPKGYSAAPQAPGPQPAPAPASQSTLPLDGPFGDDDIPF